MLIELTGGIWVKGSDLEGLTFECNGELGDLLEVFVDGEVLTEENYDVSAGSTIVTLKGEYLNTLGVGDHTLALTFQEGEIYAGGTVETGFMVALAEMPSIEDGPDKELKTPAGEKPEAGAVKSKAPKTGDGGSVLIIFLLMAAGATICMSVIKRERS